MRYLNEAQRILEDAYISLVNDALKNDNKLEGSTLRCCKCKRCDVTLRRLHKDIYACNDCIVKQSKTELNK